MGLRNLKSIGMLPVKSAFVKFDVDSLFAKSEDNAKLRDLKTLKT